MQLPLLLLCDVLQLFVLLLQAIVLQLQRYKLRGELAVALLFCFELPFECASLQVNLRELQLGFDKLIE
jgi:hypothetical protein